MSPTATNGTTTRTRDPDRTRAEILEVAVAEFARSGYAGARVDEIARRTRTTKRMIYYYFGGKEGLYVAALTSAYARIREHELRLDLEDLDPLSALRRLTEMTFDYHHEHPEFVRLVQVENIHGAEHLRREMEAVQHTGRDGILAVIADVLERGREAGVLRGDVTPVEVHTMMSALCFYPVGNRATVSVLFAYDMGEDGVSARRRTLVADAMAGWLAA